MFSSKMFHSCHNMRDQLLLYCRTQFQADIELQNGTRRRTQPENSVEEVYNSTSCIITKIGNQKVIIQEGTSVEKPKKSKKGGGSKKKRKHILAVVKVKL